MMQRKNLLHFLSYIFISLVFERSFALNFVDDNGTFTTILETSPFYYPSHLTSRFDQQVAMVDGEFCGPNHCFVSELSLLRERNTHCHQCMCSEDCFLYHDCCPSISVNANIPYRKMGSICRQPGSKPSKNGQRYFLKSICPVGQPPDLVYQCEESTDLDIDVQMPVVGLGPDGFGDFKNKYCAECHGFVETFYVSTLIECINSSHVFTDPSSVLDIINAALIADDCTIDYNFIGVQCEVSDEDGIELIDSCNQTGLWEEYDELVLKGCLLKSYKIPVFDKYYNIFCYLCNHNYTWGEVMFNLYYSYPPCQIPEICEDDQAHETEKYRLKGVIDDSLFMEMTSNGTNPCLETDDTGVCRDILCPPQHEFSEKDSICIDKVMTNVYGYEVCFVRESFESDPSQAALELNTLINDMKKQFELLFFVIHSSERYDLEMWNCNGKVFFRVQTRFQLASLHVISLSYFRALVGWILRGSLFKPPEKCGHFTMASVEENNCKVNVILNTRSRDDLPVSNPMIFLVKSVLYLPFSKLTECCQTRLKRFEYDIDEFGNLTMISSQITLEEGDYMLDVNETVRVCIDDIAQPPYKSPCNQMTFEFRENDFNSDTTTPFYETYDLTIPPEAIVYDEESLYRDGMDGSFYDLVTKNETPTESTIMEDSIDKSSSNQPIVPLFLSQFKAFWVIMYFFFREAAI